MATDKCIVWMWYECMYVINKQKYEKIDIRTLNFLVFWLVRFLIRKSGAGQFNRARTLVHPRMSQLICTVYLNFKSAHPRIITRWGNWARQSCGACLPMFGSVLRISACLLMFGSVLWTRKYFFVCIRIWIWGVRNPIKDRYTRG